MPGDTKQDGRKREMVGEVRPEVVELTDKLLAMLEGFEAGQALSALACCELNILLRLPMTASQKGDLYLAAMEKMLQTIYRHG